ncbi:MAG: AAA family ATPase [Planctomycetes bacterium]|nr:AAA family ATPase [Planctomycetota bacterium]
MPFAPTPSQSAALEALFEFVRGDGDCFVLTGGAGTGKTSLLGAFLEHLRAQRIAHQLLAPTGRAARILASKTRGDARTIHGAIYQLDQLEVLENASGGSETGLRLHFRLRDEGAFGALLVIDEASMIADQARTQDALRFGSGALLADLLRFARLAPRGERSSKIVFVGDPAQLPPVGQELSPALSPEHLHQRYGLRVAAHELREILRQREGTALLDCATTLRDALQQRRYDRFQLGAPIPRPLERVEASIDVGAVSVGAGIELVVSAERERQGSSALICGTNAAARDLNRAVRARLRGRESAPIEERDLLLVNQNAPRYGLFNGDLVRVLEIEPETEVRRVVLNGVEQPIDLRFRPAVVGYRDPALGVTRVPCLLLENLLESAERGLTPAEQRALLVDFRRRFPDLAPGSAEFSLALQDDPHYNALQVKYGYALTCHKAQGGEWDRVVVHFGGMRALRSEGFFRWAYTAITRARKQLLTIAAPRFEPGEPEGFAG